MTLFTVRLPLTRIVRQIPGRLRLLPQLCFIAFFLDDLDDLVRFHLRVIVGDRRRSRIEIDRSALHAISLAQGVLDLGLARIAIHASHFEFGSRVCRERSSDEQDGYERAEKHVLEK